MKAPRRARLVCSAVSFSQTLSRVPPLGSLRSAGKSTMETISDVVSCGIVTDGKTFSAGCVQTSPAMPMSGLDVNLGRSSKKATKQRFKRLPIHKVCYDQSASTDNNSEMFVNDLTRATAPRRKRWRFLKPRVRPIDTGTQQDEFGMTPLHILACSKQHDLHLYQLLIEKYPENLITPDSWGRLPLLYACWNDAPRGVVQLLADRQRSLFPEHAIDWIAMVDAVGRGSYMTGRASAVLACIKVVFDAQKRTCPDHDVMWQKAVTEWASQDTNRASDRLAQKFHHLVFKELVLFSLSDRLKSLSVRKWQDEILGDVDALPWFLFYRRKSTEMVYSKLSYYERMDKLKTATSLLELVLWKVCINSMANDENTEIYHFREQSNVQSCRVRCGADVVVPNVLLFLLPS